MFVDSKTRLGLVLRAAHLAMGLEKGCVEKMSRNRDEKLACVQRGREDDWVELW
jgi:hypothetical protein